MAQTQDTVVALFKYLCHKYEAYTSLLGFLLGISDDAHLTVTVHTLLSIKRPGQRQEGYARRVVASN